MRQLIVGDTVFLFSSVSHCCFFFVESYDGVPPQNPVLHWQISGDRSLLLNLFLRIVKGIKRRKKKIKAKAPNISP